ncbi:MAG: GAF domain-containing protein [Rhodobacterales bacterium]|nr:GAF domain-containing protein [Rhodobacterales bacterium]
MQYTITAQNGDSVRIAAPNWMFAMGKALPFFALDLVEAGKIVCSHSDGGDVFVAAPMVHKTWMIREVAPALKIVATKPKSVEAELPAAEPVVDEKPEVEAVSVLPPPSFMMPVTSTLQKAAPNALPIDDDEEEEETLAERLFDLSMDITGAKPDEACELALALLLEFVPVEAVSVARGSLNDPHLTFVAATGPVAAAIIGKNVPFGEGLVGLAFDMAGTLLVADVTADSRHMVSVDDETGFSTQSALCVPILDSDERAFGIIQLLNPKGHKFTAEHIEAAETIAGTLGTALAAHFA